MFKPLLKTIPSLSGNMKLVCKLEGYEKKSSDTYIYDCYVNNACLTSISNDLYDKNIEVNLKNNSFEYDVKKFYLYYASVFYKTNFNYSKVNIPVIDFSSNINSNNQDFNYGCKRVSYMKSDNQFAFFAPIYIESLEDLKGKYFLISCTFNKTYKLTKYIKIDISNVNTENYLADYLARYASKIDDKVIYLSSSYKNIYYGIDLRNGGFVKVEDNISQNLYNKYFTINDFDATINNGFKRNYLMMKQILALSFYFDPQNLLYDFEKKIFNNAEIVISGQWYDENNNPISFYNFSDDYSLYKEDIFNLYYKNEYKYVDTDINIMNIGYPGCNESSSENYKYVNTVAKNYNRWKLKYSNDEYPYIINNNFAFSYNQQSLYLYKEFPSMYTAMEAYVKLVSNTEYNMLLDYENIYDTDHVTILNNKDKYFQLYNNKYISNFFDLFIYSEYDIIDNVSLDEPLEQYTIDYQRFKNNRCPKNYYDLDNGIFKKYYKKLVAIDHFNIDELQEYIVETYYYIIDNFEENSYVYSSLKLDLRDYNFFNTSHKLNYKETNIAEYLLKFYDKYVLAVSSYVWDDQGDPEYYEVPHFNNGLSLEGYTSILNFDYKEKTKKESINYILNYVFNILYIEILKEKGYIEEDLSELSELDKQDLLMCDKEFMNIVLYDKLKYVHKRPLDGLGTRGRLEYHTLDNLYSVAKLIIPKVELIDDDIQVSWYSLERKISAIGPHDETKINIFHDYYKDSFWTNVDKDGKVYHKGILYDLNSIYKENLDKDYRIDKFGVFVKPEFDYTLAKDYNDIYKESKFAITYDFTINDIYDTSKIYNYYEMTTKSSYILNNVLVKKDNDGEYVDISFIDNLRQYDNNKYFDLNDILILYLKNTSNPDISNNNYDLNDLFIDKIYDRINNKEVSLEIIDGYKVIDIYNINNIYSEYFEMLPILFNKANDRNEDGIIFRSKKFIWIEDFYWAIDKVYFSIYPNNTKYSLIDNYKLLDEYKEKNTRIVLYYKTKMIKDDENTSNYFNLKLGSSFYENIGKLFKYYYANCLYDKKNKISYTSKVFKKIDSIEENYGNILVENDKNIIYVDPYNLNEILNKYVEKGKTIDEEDLTSTDPNNREEFYSLFLNLDHIRLYFDKLYKNQNILDESTPEDILNTIYLKIRNFNDIVIDLHDDANTNLSTLSVSDEFIQLKDFHINNISELLDYISFDSKTNSFYFSERYIDEIINKGKYHSEKILPELNHFELCFKKQMVKLNTDLYNLIITRENDDIFKDLYLYHLYDPMDYKCEMYYNNIKYDINKVKKLKYDFLRKSSDKNKLFKDEDSFYYKLNDEEIQEVDIDSILDISTLIKEKSDKNIFVLYPYFKEVYDENQTETKIYSDYFINNIISCIDSENNIRYRYNVSNIDMLVYIPNNTDLSQISEELDKREFDNHRYTIVKDVQDRFITASEFKSYNVVENPENVDEMSNMISYSYNGINYGFYIINSYFDNTKSTLNMHNYDLDHINCVDYIDNINVSYILNYSYSYLIPTYKNIMPYFKVTDPVKFIINNSNALIKPQIYKLKNTIKQYANIENDVAYSYTLYNGRKPMNIELSRYFDNIVPYIPEAKYITSYNLYYKNTNKFIENDLDIIHTSYIMHKEKSNINDKLVISYFDSNSKIHKYSPTEYKNYNNNLFYNLENEIIIDIDKIFTESELIEYENNEDNIFNLFVNYINIDKFNTMNDKDKISNYLFLYKKYSVSFIKDYKYINSSNSRVFTLKIKFSLL